MSLSGPESDRERRGRIRSLLRLAHRLDPLLWLFAGTGGLLETVIHHYDEIAGANTARMAGLIGCAIGGAVCCFFGAVPCAEVARRLARKSPNADWFGGLVGVVLVMLIPHTSIPEPASGRPAIPPGFTYVGPAPKRVPPPTPGFVLDTQLYGDFFPPGELAKLQGGAAATTYFSCDLHNSSNWTLSQLTIQVKVLDADGKLVYSQTFTNTDGNLTLTPSPPENLEGARERFLCFTTLAREVMPGQKWEWNIVSARGHPASP